MNACAFVRIINNYSYSLDTMTITQAQKMVDARALLLIIVNILVRNRNLYPKNLDDQKFITRKELK